MNNRVTRIGITRLIVGKQQIKTNLKTDLFFNHHFTKVDQTIPHPA